jgi:hypothetical protein
MAKPTFDPTGTIGSLPCEVALNRILAERNNDKEIRSITQLVQKVRFRLKQLKHVPDKETAQYFCLLVKRDAEKRLEEITGHAVRKILLTDTLTSHTMNVLHAYFHEFNKNILDF